MNFKHGFARNGQKSPEYVSWRAMLRRCCNEKSMDYAGYGGRGITVCERWLNFANFLGDMGPKPSQKHSIDRFPDLNGNYEPTNCRWATMRQQARNTKRNRKLTFHGLTLCMAEWAEKTGMTQATIRGRLRLGWSDEEILTTLDDGRNRLLSFQGISQGVSAWERDLGFPPGVIKQRLNKCGWSVEKALSTPLLR